MRSHRTISGSAPVFGASTSYKYPARLGSLSDASLRIAPKSGFWVVYALSELMNVEVA